MTYTAVCERVGDWWEITVPELESGRVTQAESLEDVETTVQDLVALMTEVAPENVIVDIHRRTQVLATDLTFVCAEPGRDTDENFHAFTNAVGESMHDLAQIEDSGVIEPQLGVSIAERAASIRMGVTADTVGDAVRLFLANVRTVLHAAGCGTSDWPMFEPTAQPDADKVAFIAA
jgi:predicted RNase H-like HicB family nuclease/enamine deaminase RidA (YjgF/YER057c/UK114 family)